MTQQFHRYLFTSPINVYKLAVETALRSFSFSQYIHTASRAYRFSYLMDKPAEE
jgi:hypothetical protein